MQPLDSVINNAKIANKRNDGDYRDESGLLICGKCHTPKECRVPGFKDNMPTPCECKIAEEKERQRKEAAEKAKVRRQWCFQGSKKTEWTFEMDDKANAKLSTLARNYADRFPVFKDRGLGLLLYGEVGSGKSFAAACICNALIDKGYSCLFTSFAGLHKRIRDEDAEYLDRLNRVSLLVIDDLGAERDTDYMQEIVHNIIDERCSSGRPVIITTNWTAEQIKNAKDIKKQRVISRLYDVCFPFEVKGEDRRKEKLRDNYTEWKTMLGLND